MHCLVPGAESAQAAGRVAAEAAARAAAGGGGLVVITRGDAEFPALKHG